MIYIIINENCHRNSSNYVFIKRPAVFLCSKFLSCIVLQVPHIHTIMPSDIFPLFYKWRTVVYFGHLYFPIHSAVRTDENILFRIVQ
jgi:hypothetical protein